MKETTDGVEFTWQADSLPWVLPPEAELGVKLENVDLSYLGRCQRVVADQEHTTLVGGGGDKSAIDGRKRELRARIEKTTSD